MNEAREFAYRIDPVLWVHEILGVTPATWQETFLRTPRGASILALTARQVGKTTTAVSIAACLAERGTATLLLDLDPQANATSALGLEKLSGGSVYKALLGNAQLMDSIRPSGLANLDVIPSEVDLAVAEVDVARSENYLQRLQFALTPIQGAGKYEFIVVRGTSWFREILGVWLARQRLECVRFSAVFLATTTGW